MYRQFELRDLNQRPLGVTKFIGREIVRNISWWQGDARVGNRPARGCCLLSVVADKPGGCSLLPIGIGKQGVVASFQLQLINQGVVTALPIGIGKQGVVASFQSQLIKQGVISSFQSVLVNRVQYHPCLQQPEKLLVNNNFVVIGRIGGLPYWDSTLKLCSVYSCCYVCLIIYLKNG